MSFGKWRSKPPENLHEQQFLELAVEQGQQSTAHSAAESLNWA
jgi:hypothetical protein